MLRHAGVGSTGKDPCTGCLGCLEKAFPKAPLQPWLKVEVGLAPVDGDQELGLLQAPFPQKKSEDKLRLGVVGKTNVLQKRKRFLSTLRFIRNYS